MSIFSRGFGRRFEGPGTIIREDQTRPQHKRIPVVWDLWRPPLVAGLGLWLDPRDPSTLFQERTGASASTPAQVGDPVGTILDKSGNGNHATAPSDGARPTLTKDALGNPYLDFDASASQQMELPHGSIPDPDGDFTVSCVASNDDTTNAGFWSNGRFETGQSNTIRTGGGAGDPHYLHFIWGNSVTVGAADGLGSEPIDGAAHVLTVFGLGSGARELHVDRTISDSTTGSPVANAGSEASLLGRGVAGEHQNGGLWQIAAYTARLQGDDLSNLEQFMYDSYQ